MCQQMQQKPTKVTKMQPRSQPEYYALLCFIHAGESFPLGTIRSDRTLTKHGPGPHRQSPNAITRQPIHIYESNPTENQNIKHKTKAQNTLQHSLTPSISLQGVDSDHLSTSIHNLMRSERKL